MFRHLLEREPIIQGQQLAWKTGYQHVCDAIPVSMQELFFVHMIAHL
jgi:hypothetical protein